MKKKKFSGKGIVLASSVGGPVVRWSKEKTLDLRSPEVGISAFVGARRSLSTRNEWSS